MVKERRRFSASKQVQTAAGNVPCRAERFAISRWVRQSLALAGTDTRPPDARGHVLDIGGRHYLVLIENAAASGTPVVVATVYGIPQRDPPEPVLQERYGLTGKEAQVAILLARRYSNLEIASSLSVSIHTARHHVEMVLRKLRVRRKQVAAALATVSLG
jgi:DNA-binding CsgD family transcriptional regulator